MPPHVCVFRPSCGIAKMISGDVLLSARNMRRKFVVQACSDAADHRLRRGQRARVVRRAGVDLGVQVQLGEQHLRRRRRRAAVVGRAGRRQRRRRCVQLADEEVVDLGPRRLLRRRGAQRIVLASRSGMSPNRSMPCQ